MIENRVKQIWAEGRPVLNGWLSVGNAFVAEVMAAQGYDALTIDVQHGALDYSDVLPMMQAMRASGVVVGARVPWLEPGIIMKMLDAGALQVICPMINTAEEAARFVSFLRYPPVGQRSFGPSRAVYAQGGNIAAEANDRVIGWAMVETRTALDNLEAIAATPGLDGIYVGPADLTFSLSEGRLAPGFDRDEPEMVEVLRRIVDVCHRAGIKAALHCGTPDYAARAVAWGYDMTTVSGDFRLMADAATDSISRFRELTGTAGPEGTVET
ncbi:HpcH/HpaI aldolase family protein [Pseudoponticoccus marisrubri]|uniref:2,4-dihydroxyhept-2-ene-1,7-dioic acid aldolase n=1 Tax=Pseudoponticoccus marisrubri TaxID=1685382 RepID=A0A0W7WN27_9RHOB|nr:aldolase/citrate lyase family protein [Pseudoponticoccus marisrubri]KUF11980.1 2,4-dihydroxyhept-2-ene-1,7-dioic acid aldolase [Pseudoponticoccus marisrubri]